MKKGNNTLNEDILAKETIDEVINERKSQEIPKLTDSTIKSSEKILKINEVNDPNKLKIIKDIIKYVNKFPEIFLDYAEKYDHLFVSNGNPIRLKYDIEIYTKDFFLILDSNIKRSIEYQKVLSNIGEVEFCEALLRINTNSKNFNHIDYLQIYKDFGKDFYVFYNILNRIFYDISINNIKGNISFNVEVSDILDKRFIKTIEFLKKKYNINLSNTKIVIEILENQQLPHTIEFKNKIILLKQMGFDIAYDDVISPKIPLEKTNKQINFLGKYIDIIKLDGETLQTFYKTYNTAKDIFKQSFINFKTELSKIQEKGIKIVAEWVEDLSIYNFAKDVLGIGLFQGFFSDKKENLELLKNNNR